MAHIIKTPSHNHLPSNILYFHFSQYLHRSFLTGPLPINIPSKLKETKSLPSSGRASPLVSAGEVLDKYFTLSKHHKDQPTSTPIDTKVGIDRGVRQGDVMLPMLF